MKDTAIMIVMNLILIIIMFTTLGRKGGQLIEYDQKAKNIYDIKPKKYFFMELFFLLMTFGTSFYIIKELNGDSILEALKLGFVFLLFTLYKKKIIFSLKESSRKQIEEQFEYIRYEASKDKKKAVKKFELMEFKDDYKYYIIFKEFNDEYIELCLLDRFNNKKKYSFKIFISE